MSRPQQSNEFEKKYLDNLTKNTKRVDTYDFEALDSFESLVASSLHKPSPFLASGNTLFDRTAEYLRQHNTYED